jgi:hypothetical protein
MPLAGHLDVLGIIFGEAVFYVKPVGPSQQGKVDSPIKVHSSAV